MILTVPSKKILVLLALYIVAITIVAVTSIGGTYLYLDKNKKIDHRSESVISGQEATTKAINFIKETYFKVEGIDVSLVSVSEDGDLYKFKFEVKQGEQKQEYDSYVSKDGKFVFPERIDLVEATIALVETTAIDAMKDIEKKDNPEVKLFIMTYCPYGLQAQKAFLPVIDLLKDKADIGIYFVDYVMHEKKEIDENLRQYCIQKEQKDKYINYLNCFTTSASGDYQGCLKKVGIDEVKMNSCVSETDSTYKVSANYNDKKTWSNGKYPKFDVQKDLNDKYEIGGSPSLVINDTVIVSDQKHCPQNGTRCIVAAISRSSEEFKKAICEAFTSAPSECSTILSADEAAPGFGSATGTGSSSGGCGQ